MELSSYSIELLNGNLVDIAVNQNYIYAGLIIF